MIRHGPATQRLSKAEEVRRYLVSEIESGRLQPGQKLGEEDLAARLACSRTPVREALRHLDAVGLVRYRPHQGAVVARLDQRVMFDLHIALAELEAACAELASHGLSEDDRQRLLSLPPEASSDLLAILHRAAGNSVLTEMADAVRSRLQPYRGAGAHVPEGDVGAVVRAVVGGDGTAARQAMRRHMLTGPGLLP
jgi:DNA-binding GntR family transcriptional regulator